MDEDGCIIHLIQGNIIIQPDGMCKIAEDSRTERLVDKAKNRDKSTDYAPYPKIFYS